MAQNSQCREAHYRSLPATAIHAILVMTSSLGSLIHPCLGILLQPIPKPIEFSADVRLNPTEFCRIEFPPLRPALRKKVILDLWLCSRWTHRDARSVFEFEDRHLLFGNRVAFHVPDRLSFEIFDIDHL